MKNASMLYINIYISSFHQPKITAFESTYYKKKKKQNVPTKGLCNEAPLSRIKGGLRLA